LKAELELSDHPRILRGATDAVVEAIGIVDTLQHMAQASDPVVIVLDDDVRLAELTARQLLRAGIDARSGSDPVALRDFHPATTQVLIDLTLLRGCNALQLSALERFRPIVMSGDVSTHARLEAASYSATAFLVKPFTLAEMLDSLGKRHRTDSS
jgi:DNA-binding NtrC family response regulator